MKARTGTLLWMVRGLSIVIFTCVYISLNGFLTEKKSKSMSKTYASPSCSTWQTSSTAFLIGHSLFLRELEAEHSDNVSVFCRGPAFCPSSFFRYEVLWSRSPGATDEEADAVLAVSSVFSFSFLADATSPFSSWWLDASVGLMRITCKFKDFWFSSWSAGTYSPSLKK